MQMTSLKCDNTYTVWRESLLGGNAGKFGKQPRIRQIYLNQILAILKNLTWQKFWLR